MREQAIAIRLVSENAFVNERVPQAWRRMPAILTLGS
jgi:hypothetical protein